MMHVLAKILILIFFGEVIAPAPRRTENAAPEIVDHPDDQIVAKDSPTTLNCRADGYPTPEIRWYKDGELLNTGYGHYTQMGNGNLFIVNVETKRSRSDDGVYQCEARNSLGVARSNNATLVVAYLKEEFRLEPSNTDGVVGSPLVLECQPPKGNPSPIISWEKNGRAIQPDGDRVRVLRDGNLMISPAVIGDSGSYRCIATIDVIGSKTSSSARVEIHERPAIVTGPDDVTALPGETVTLECIAEGQPAPSIDWLKDGGPLPEARFTTRSNSLVIRNTVEEDSGMYACVAENRWGSVRAVAEVEVDASPRFSVRPVDQTIREGQDIEVPCQAIGSPPPALMWISENSEDYLYPRDSAGKLTISASSSLIIRDADVASEGIYICSTFSEQGMLESPMTLRVVPDEYNLPPIIQYGPSDQILAIRDTARLRCKVGVSLGREDSDVTVTWLKDDIRVDGRNQRISQTDEGTLLVSSLESQDGGVYTCIIGNDVGETSMSARLQVIRETDSSTFLSQPPPDLSDLPGAPGMPTLFNQSAGTVTIGWTRPHLMDQRILSYTVEGINTEDASDAWKTYGSSETNRIGLRNLPTETRMMFVVRAQNAEGVGPPSPISHPIIAAESRMGVEAISSDLELGLSEPPVELPWVYINGVTPLSSTTIQVTWRVDPSEVMLDGFRVQYKESLTSGQWLTETITNANMVILNDLQENTEYDIRVVAFSGDHEGDQSNEVKVRTLDEDTDDLIIPRESVLQTKLNECGISIRKIDVLGPTEVKISWQVERNTDYIDGFYVRLRSVDDPEESIETIENKQVKVIRNLEPWTSYTVVVQPYSGVFKGPETDRVVVRTAEMAPQAPPEVLGLQPFNTTAFLVQWRAPARDEVPGIILGYHISCRNTPTNHQSNIVITGNTTFDGIVGNLTPGLSYGIRVAAFTVAGIGPFSATKFETLPPVINGPTSRGGGDPDDQGDSEDSLGFLAHPVVFAVIGVVFLLLLTSCLLLIWRRRRKKHTHSVHGDKEEAAKENAHKLGQVAMTKGSHAVACCSGDGSSSASSGSLEKPPPPPSNHPQQVPSHWLQDAYDPPQFKQPNKVFLRHDSLTTSGVSSSNYPTLSTFHGNHMSANSPEYAVVENPDGTSSPSPVPGIVYGPPVHPTFLPVGSMVGHLQHPGHHHLMEDPEPYASATLVLPSMRKPPCSDSSSEWTNSWNSQDHRKKGPQHFEQPRKGSRDGGPPVPRRDHSVSGFSDQSSLYSSASSQGGGHRVPRHHHRLNNHSPANWSELMPPPPEQSPPTDPNAPPPLPNQPRPRQSSLERQHGQHVNSHHVAPHGIHHQSYPVNSMNIHEIQQQQMNSHNLHTHQPMAMNIHENYPVAYPGHFEHPQGPLDMHRTPHPIHGYSYDGAFQPTGPPTHSLERQDQYCERCPDCTNAQPVHQHGGSFHGDKRRTQSPRTVQSLNAQNGAHDTRTYPGPAHGEHFQMAPMSYQNSSPRPRKKGQSGGKDPVYAQMQQSGSDHHGEGSSGSSIASQRVFVDPRHAQIGQELLKYMSQGELQALAGSETSYAPMKPSQTSSNNGNPAKMRSAVSDSEMDDGAKETDFDLISNGRLSASCASLTSCNTSQCNSNCSGSEGSLITDMEINDALSNMENNLNINGSSLNGQLPTGPPGAPQQPNAATMVSRFDGTKVKPSLMHATPDSRQRMLAAASGKQEDVV